MINEISFFVGTSNELGYEEVRAFQSIDYFCQPQLKGIKTLPRPLCSRMKGTLKRIRFHEIHQIGSFEEHSVAAVVNSTAQKILKVECLS